MRLGINLSLRKKLLSTRFFDPTKISGCALWLRADKGITMDGSNRVAIWADQSGNGVDGTQTVNGNKPIWTTNFVAGRPALHFDGTDDFLQADSFATEIDQDDTPLTFFCVFQCLSEVAIAKLLWHHQLEKASAPNHYVSHTGGLTYRYLRASAAGPGNTVTGGTCDTSWHSMILTYAADAASMWIDGTVIIDNQAIVVGDMLVMDRFRIGSGMVDGEEAVISPFLGYIAEFGFYSAVLGATDRAALSNYLGDRYLLH